MLIIEGVRKVLYEEFKVKYKGLDEAHINEKVQEELDRLFKDGGKDKLSDEIKDLENREMLSFLDIHTKATGKDLTKMDDFLYYSLGHQNYLEDIIEIFETRRIYPNRKINNKYYYKDNYKDQEYITLLEYDGDYGKNFGSEYDTFIKPNIAFIISPQLNPKKSIYVSEFTLLEIKDSCPDPKNHYSCNRGEYLVKDYISLDNVKAIGIPYSELLSEGKSYLAERWKEDIKALLEIYDLNLPIVDTSSKNCSLIECDFIEINKRK